MRFSTSLRALLFLAIAALMPLSAQGQATLTEGDPIIPSGLVAGDSFHYAFTTSGVFQAPSADIRDYNGLTQFHANSSTFNPWMSNYSWNVIASTAAVHARDNALVGAGAGTDNSPVYTPTWNGIDTDPIIFDPDDPDYSVPVRLADGFESLWDGDIQADLKIDENGDIVPWSGVFEANVFTGSTTDGFLFVDPTLVTPDNQVTFRTAAGHAGLGGFPWHVNWAQSNLHGGGWIDIGSVEVHQPGGSGEVFHYYALSEQIFVEPAAPGTEHSWRNNLSGDWSGSTESWAPLGIPGAGETVNFGDAITEDQFVFSNQSVSVSIVNFDNANSYTIGGLGELSLDDQINVLQGDHTFQVDVKLLADLAVNVASGLTLTFDGVVDLNGFNLTETGLGTVVYNRVGSPIPLSGSAEASVVPEPTSLALMGWAVAVSPWFGRRRRRRRRFHFKIPRQTKLTRP
jgi:hypothetical protein